MIKDAEDKGLITRGKVSNENVSISTDVFLGSSYKLCTLATLYGSIRHLTYILLGCMQILTSLCLKVRLGELLRDSFRSLVVF